MAHGGIAAGREVKSRFPRSEANRRAEAKDSCSGWTCAKGSPGPSLEMRFVKSFSRSTGVTKNRDLCLELFCSHLSPRSIYSTAGRKAGH